MVAGVFVFEEDWVAGGKFTEWYRVYLLFKKTESLTETLHGGARDICFSKKEKSEMKAENFTV